jgi:hypothetical protein
VKLRDADAEVLICYDGSDDGERAIAAAAALFGRRRAVVLIVPPVQRAA